MVSSLLQVQNLSVRFGTVTVVDGIDLSINPGETLALVGESGCGKSVTALSILRLLPAPGIISGGGVAWTGQDLLKLPLRALNDLRGGDIATIWQDPLAALNPVLPIGTPIIEALVRHRNLSSAEARTVAIETLQRVGIAQAEKRLKDYPHQLSGGQRQRVMIAAAIAGKPKLLIADEPTTALDVSVQAQILELLRGLIRDTGTAMLLITHDLGVVAQIANRVAVMYAGQIVEQGTTAQIFEHPQHPYTQGLLLATPRLHGDSMPLPIPGVVPPPGRWPTGCRFKTRCPLYTQPTCDD
ncbi:MAG: ABC transporter ATP-binding protein, partial [Abitibacteriaceae bacterium]|nr:ABC transporter ATP-binding protein [Abditibacteriaceae bacterium]